MSGQSCWYPSPAPPGRNNADSKYCGSLSSESIIRKVLPAVTISETVLILAGGTAVLAILFGIRLAKRALAGSGAAGPAGGSGAPDVAGVIALPPLIYLGFLAAATVLEVVVPSPLLTTHGALLRYLAGAALAVGGFVMIAMGSRRFQAAGTNIPPTLPTTALVVDGIYRRTRNPIYLGTTLVYLGLGVTAGSPWAIALLVPLIWVINVGVVAREERYLERKFGDAYLTYKARVRRWI
jgi:protein-S-isoprenylcysteine O-methyltransferase Ste14